MREHIAQANAAIVAFLDATPLRFKEAEIWKTELEMNSRALASLPAENAAMARLMEWPWQYQSKV